jgi:hypothetical protein
LGGLSTWWNVWVGKEDACDLITQYLPLDLYGKHGPHHQPSPESSFYTLMIHWAPTSRTAFSSNYDD